MKSSRSILAVLATTALFLAPVTFDLPIVGGDIAYAKGGNGGGNGGGDGGGNGGGKSASAKSSGTSSSGARSASGGGTSKSKPKAKQSSQDELAAVETVAEPKNMHGLLASELKGLNAVHANPNALENASPNSQVGRIALYRDAALATVSAGSDAADAAGVLTDAQTGLADAIGDLDALDASYAGRSVAEIDADAGALDPAALDYQAQLDALLIERDTAVAFEAGRAGLAATVDTATIGVTDAEIALAEAEAAAAAAEATESEALLTAANGRTLSDDALAYLREQLGL